MASIVDPDPDDKRAHPPETVPALLDKLDELLRIGTERPWLRWHDQEHIPGWDGFRVIGDAAEEGEECNPTARVYTDYDADLILAAVNTLPGLVSIVREMWDEDNERYGDSFVCDDLRRRRQMIAGALLGDGR